MEWTRLVIGVLLYLQSYGQENNRTTTDIMIVNTEDFTEVPAVPEVPKAEFKNIIIKVNENIPQNLNNQDKLVLCLKSTTESTSCEFQSICYSAMKEDNSDDWTLEGITHYPGSCVSYEGVLYSKLNRMIGALGGTIGVLLVALVASIPFYIHSEDLRKKLFGSNQKDVNEANTEEKQKLHSDNQTFVSDANAEEEQEEETAPIPPRRPSHTFPEDRASYVQANTIQVWQVMDMKNNKELLGTVVME